MGANNYSDEFKCDAVQQIRLRGYRVQEVSQRLGGEFALALQVDDAFRGPSSQGARVDHEAENRRLKREQARVTEERYIRKKATAYFAQESQ